MRRPGVALPLLIAVLASSGVANAMYSAVQLELVPIARLTEKLEKQVARSPHDSGALLNLARVHTMAFAMDQDVATVRSGTLDLFRPFEGAYVFSGTLDGTPGYYDDPFRPAQISTCTLALGDPERWRVPIRSLVHGDPGARAVATRHLSLAIETYRKLVAIEPGNLIGRLGLGWCLAEAGEKEEARSVLRKLVVDASVAEKRQFGADRPPDWTYVTEEASGHLVRLLDRTADAEEIAAIHTRVRSMPPREYSITPIVVPLGPGCGVADLVASDSQVRFNLDGYALDGTWSWITPRAGWLVWLPRDGSRQVRDGLQLFGNVTWWLFWRDGYEALAALDDDGDGVLRGSELERLGIWQDRNGNGRVDPGEVRTLEECGIAELACGSEPGERPDVARWSPRGVVFRSGEVRPTWDVLLRFTPAPQELALLGRQRETAAAPFPGGRGEDLTILWPPDATRLEVK